MFERLAYYSGNALVFAVVAWVGFAAFLTGLKRVGLNVKCPLWLLFASLWLISTFIGFLGGSWATNFFPLLAIIVLIIGILFYFFSLSMRKKGMVEGPLKEEKSESQQTVLEPKAVDCQPSDRKFPTDFDLTEADLENETKTCSACKKTIKLLAKKCRFCGVLFEQNEIERAIKSKSIELLERKLIISLDDEVKKCPACAETINVKSMECEFCGEVFDPSEVDKQAKDLISEKLHAKSAENVTSNPESEPYIDNIENIVRLTFIAGFVCLAVLSIIMVLGYAFTPDSKNNKANYSPEEPGYLKKEPGTFKVDLDRELAGTYELGQRGIAFMEKGDYQQAINEFNKLIELNPLDHAAYNSRGETYLKSGGYQQAREDFNRAIIAIDDGHEANPENFAKFTEFNKKYGLQLTGRDSLKAKYYRNRGLAYDKLGNKTQAIQDLKIAARVGDKEAQKYLLLKEMTW